MQIRLQLKIAMSLYYLGDMGKSANFLRQLTQFYKRFEFKDMRVQQKLIKLNFYAAKSIISEMGSETKHKNANYGEALKFLNYNIREDFDPELHELYSGNSFFEMAKIFLKQRDLINAYDYI